MCRDSAQVTPLAVQPLGDDRESVVNGVQITNPVSVALIGCGLDLGLTEATAARSQVEGSFVDRCQVGTPVARFDDSVDGQRGLSVASRCSSRDRQSSGKTFAAPGLLAGGKAVMGDHAMPIVTEAVTRSQLESVTTPDEAHAGPGGLPVGRATKVVALVGCERRKKRNQSKAMWSQVGAAVMHALASQLPGIPNTLSFVNGKSVGGSFANRLANSSHFAKVGRGKQMQSMGSVDHKKGPVLGTLSNSAVPINSKVSHLSTGVLTTVKSANIKLVSVGNVVQSNSLALTSSKHSILKRTKHKSGKVLPVNDVKGIALHLVSGSKFKVDGLSINKVRNGTTGAGGVKSQAPGPVPAPSPQVVRQPVAQGPGGLNAKQRKRPRRKLKKQKGKSVLVDKSPEVGTSGVQPGLVTGTRGVQALQSVPTSNAFALLRQEGAKGPLTGPASLWARDASPVMPGGPRSTGGRSYSDSDVPRAGQEADLEGFGFETDQEFYLDQQPVPANVSNVTFKRGLFAQDQFPVAFSLPSDLMSARTFQLA
nr:hypothetical protein Iba_chr02bCG13300 [Ipomoea batatas]